MVTSQSSRNVLIFGATGAIGPYLARALLDTKQSFNKITIFTSAASLQRNSGLLDTFKIGGADLVTGDIYNEGDVRQVYRDHDVVISALGRTALPHQTTLIRLAEDSGTIERFYPSEWGTDIEYSEAATHEVIHQDKLAVRKYLRENTRRLEYTFIVTGPYADGLLAPFPPKPEIGSFQISHRKAWLLGQTGDERIAFTSREDVGKLAVASLLHPAESRNRALKVCSFVTTYNNALAEFERQTSGDSWTKEYVTPDALDGIRESLTDREQGLAGTCMLRKLWIRGDTLYPEYDNHLIGNPGMQTMQEVIAEAVAAARA